MSGNLNDLIGKTIKAISTGNDELDITVTDGEKDYRYGVRHFQDCCESVSLVKTDGNLYDAVGKVITDVSAYSDSIHWNGGGTRSVYRIEWKGEDGWEESLWLEWHGHSNGYYGEGVSFFEYREDGTYSYW